MKYEHNLVPACAMPATPGSISYIPSMYDTTVTCTRPCDRRTRSSDSNHALDALIRIAACAHKPA